MLGIKTTPTLAAMMALGLFVFGLKTIPYQQLQRQTSWRHPSNSRLKKRPSRQYLGPGDDIITLSGVLYPELTGGTLSLSLLRAQADTGKAWPLLEGTGHYYGMYVIEDMSETRTFFFPDGAARKIEFTIKLTCVDEGDTDIIGQYTKDILALL